MLLFCLYNLEQLSTNEQRWILYPTASKIMWNIILTRFLWTHSNRNRNKWSNNHLFHLQNRTSHVCRLLSHCDLAPQWSLQELYCQITKATRSNRQSVLRKTRMDSREKIGQAKASLEKEQNPEFCPKYAQRASLSHIFTTLWTQQH